MSKLKIVTLLIALSAFATPAAAALSYPSDCNAAKMRKAASKGGCSVENGAKHHKVVKGGVVITLIPNTVKANGTCRAAIKAINSSCS